MLLFFESSDALNIVEKLTVDFLEFRLVNVLFHSLSGDALVKDDAIADTKSFNDCTRRLLLNLPIVWVYLVFDFWEGHDFNIGYFRGTIAFSITFLATFDC